MAQRWTPADDEAPGLAHARATAPRVNARAGASRPADGEEGDWSWRYRRQLMPVIVAAPVLWVTLQGHLMVPDLAWTPLPVGFVGAMAFATLGTRPIHRWCAPGTALLGIWAAVAWALGPWQWVPLIGGLLLGAVATGVWFAHAIPRSRVMVVGGSRWPWERERWRFARDMPRLVGQAIDRWPDDARTTRIPGSRLQSAVADFDEGTVELVLVLAGGQILGDVDNRRVTSSLRARRGSVRLHETDHEHEVLVVWTLWELDAMEPTPPRVVPDEPGSEAEAEVGAGPAGFDVGEFQLEQLLAAIRRAGKPIGAGRAARQANLEPGWAWQTGCPELERRGLIAQEGEKWAAASQ